MAFTTDGRSCRSRLTVTPSCRSAHFHDNAADAAHYPTGRAARRVVDVLLKTHKTCVPRLPLTIHADPPPAPPPPRSVRGSSHMGQPTLA